MLVALEAQARVASSVILNTTTIISITEVVNDNGLRVIVISMRGMTVSSKVAMIVRETLIQLPVLLLCRHDNSRGKNDGRIAVSNIRSTSKEDGTNNNNFSNSSFNYLGAAPGAGSACSGEGSGQRSTRSTNHAPQYTNAESARNTTSKYCVRPSSSLFRTAQNRERNLSWNPRALGSFGN